MKKIKAKDLEPGQRVFLQKSLHEVVGKKVMAGKVVVTFKSVGRTAPEVNTKHYNPNADIIMP